jgi:nicotinate-nucleotide--dimethylbenzimidazole phosphoribosyltransferase
VSGDWLTAPAARPDPGCGAAAASRQAQLIKPPGALGRLETLAVRLAALQGKAFPAADRVHIAVFAGDHGVVAEGVAAFPQAVTAAMLPCFAHRVAAIGVLARQLGASLDIVNLGTAEPTPALDGVIDARIGSGTANFTRAPAMTGEQLTAALRQGRAAVERALAGSSQIFIGGEMGIGNSTAAAALACALLREEPEYLVGPGAGLDGAGIRRKTEVIRRALALHGGAASDPLEALRRLGGFEIAALTGAYLACAQSGLPALVDGFITGAAALAAVRINGATADWLIYGHRSAEPGHERILRALAAEPLLDLGLRLGEASGAAVAVPLLRLACALHRDMATFAEAGIRGNEQ